MREKNSIFSLKKRLKRVPLKFEHGLFKINGQLIFRLSWVPSLLGQVSSDHFLIKCLELTLKKGRKDYIEE